MNHITLLIQYLGLNLNLIFLDIINNRRMNNLNNILIKEKIFC